LAAVFEVTDEALGASLTRDAEGTEPNCSAVRRESSCKRDEVGADSERMEDGLTKLGYALAVGDVVDSTDMERGRPTVRSADTEKYEMDADSSYEADVEYSKYRWGLLDDREYSGEQILTNSKLSDFGAEFAISSLETIENMQFPPSLPVIYDMPLEFNVIAIPSAFDE